MKSNPPNLVKNSGSGKPKRKLSNKELPVNKKKSKKKEEEEKLPERYLRADELIFGKLLFERKGYRLNPIKRDGNCLFRAVAEQVYCNPNLFESLRNSCVDFMEEEEKWFSEFFAENFEYKKYLSDLRKDAFWGGNLEISALSYMFNRPFEIYEDSVEPRLVDFSKNQGNNIPPIRVCFRNKHYTTIRSDDVGDLFDFEGLKLGELEQEMVNQDLATIGKSKEFQKRIESEKKNLCKLDPDERKATEELFLFDEMENAAKRYYLSKLKNKAKKPPGNKEKSKNKDKEEMLPERFLYPDELILEKILFDLKGYRIDPIRRDGNCLFRAVAGAVYGDTEKYTAVRKRCADFMEKERDFFTPYVEQVNEQDVKVVDFDDHISILRQDAAWGGDPEIIALSGIFNCLFEVYKTSETPDLRYFPNVTANTNPTVRLFYTNNHYSIVRSGGIGDQLFNFEGLEDGELERQMEILSTSKDPKQYSESELHSSLDDKNLAHAVQLSLIADEAEKNYKQFYASRIIKGNSNEQN